MPRAREAALRATRRVPDATFEAIVVELDGCLGDGKADALALRRRVEEVCTLGLHLVLVSSADLSALDGQLQARPAGPGRLLLSVSRGSAVFEVTADGPAKVHSSELDAGVAPDHMQWIAQWLAARGITGELVLIVGNRLGSRTIESEHPTAVPGFARSARFSLERGTEGSSRPARRLELLVELLEDQFSRRVEHRVSGIDEDPAWVVPLPEDPQLERAAEAIGALSNGWAGSRASREDAGPTASPLFAANGVYSSDPMPHLLHGPDWTRLDLRKPTDWTGDRRLLDLRTGILARRSEGDARFRSIRFVSAARPWALAMRAEAHVDALRAGDSLTSAGDTSSFDSEMFGDARVACTGGGADASIAMAARDAVVMNAERRTVQRLVAWASTRSGELPRDDVLRRLGDLEGAGFETLLAEHRQAWAALWADADVTVDGSSVDQLAARFATFHLLSAAPEVGEAAVGARGLTGDAYGGHVFWDADVFVLPALAAIRPAAARAMLEYRIRRLPAARAEAITRHARGARFPWESAADGTDVTPRHVTGRDGQLIPIRTGQHEEHVVAGVAWAACHYAAWTGDSAFLTGAGRDLVVDTARYWASRIRVDSNGRGHLHGVMGPDEYHEVVDDNAYTNVMARWNLRRGADSLATTGAEGREAASWRALADALVDGWRPDRGVYEQFAGYFGLEPLLVASVATPPVAIDVLLGAERVAQSQLIKQADVLMAHHLVPDDLVANSLGQCLDFYTPRCAHGSSLSPAIHASLLARAGRADDALPLWRLAARLDLDDLTGTTAGGLHLATMGGVWQALAFGFLGLRADDGVLGIEPHLPRDWQGLALRLRFAGNPVGVHADHGTVAVTCDVPLRVRVGAGAPTLCVPPGNTFTTDRRTR